VLKHQCEIGNVQDSEIWLDIRGYEGKYQVSNLGRVKSLARERRTKGNGITKMPERIMKLDTKKDNGRQRPYIQVMLRNGDVRTINGKQKLVHRLVADAFIKNLEKGDQVDHINGKHGDNRVENLRVMYYTEHIKLHPCYVNPLPQDPITGRFLNREK
jgi:hypothetical protein